MKRGKQYLERAPDQLALLLMDFALVERVEADSWRLNAQPENLLVAAAHHGVQIRIGPKWYLCYSLTASAGHGLNLQDGGNILVYFGHWWNLNERMQILERIGPTRLKQDGHDQPVFVHNIIARDTIDEEVIERLATKREVQDILMNAMKRRFKS